VRLLIVIGAWVVSQFEFPSALTMSTHGTISAPSWRRKMSKDDDHREITKRVKQWGEAHQLGRDKGFLSAFAEQIAVLWRHFAMRGNDV
jgi:hypothetical protein